MTQLLDLSKMDDEDKIMYAVDQLSDWYQEGRVIKGYVFGKGRRFIAKLAGVDMTHVTDHRSFRYVYQRTGSNIVDAILGPNGWTLLQMAIAKLEEEQK